MLRSLLVACIAVFVLTEMAAAGESFRFHPYCGKPAYLFLPGCCPDNYCKKPLPCVYCDWCGRCDDYCKKPLPCTHCDWRGTCDDYCPKPGAIQMKVCLPPWFKCH